VTGRLLLKAVLSSGHPLDTSDRYRRSFLVRKRPLYRIIATQHHSEEEEEKEQWGYHFEASLSSHKDDLDQVRVLSMMMSFHLHDLTCTIIDHTVDTVAIITVCHRL